jgi:hypothetical protein
MRNRRVYRGVAWERFEQIPYNIVSIFGSKSTLRKIWGVAGFLLFYTEDRGDTSDILRISLRYNPKSRNLGLLPFVYWKNRISRVVS